MACLEVKCKFSQLKEGRGAVKALQKCLETAEQRLEFPLLFVSKKTRFHFIFSPERRGRKARSCGCAGCLSDLCGGTAWSGLSVRC